MCQYLNEPDFTQQFLYQRITLLEEKIAELENVLRYVSYLAKSAIEERESG